MPTVNSMVQRNDMVANVSHRYFKLDNEKADESLLVGAVVKTNADFLKSDFGGQPALTTMIENYSAEKDDFEEKFQDKMDSLRESSDKLKDSVQEDTKTNANSDEKISVQSDEHVGSALSTLENFTKNNVPPRAKILAFQPRTEKKDDNQAEKIAEQARKVREENSKQAKNLQRDKIKEFAENYLVAEKDNKDNQSMLKKPETTDENILGRIENFVRHYNSVLSYLNEHREMSNRVSALAANFTTNTGLQNALGSIGISVSSSGALSVDGTKLLNALQNDSESVNILLGSEGLTGNLDKNVDLASYQSDKLFPTIEEYSGEEKFEAWEYLYSAQNFNTANYARKKAGNILNMFT